MDHGDAQKENKNLHAFVCFLSQSSINGVGLPVNNLKVKNTS